MPEKKKSAQGTKVSLMKHLRLNIVSKHLSAKVRPSLKMIRHADHYRELSATCKVLIAFKVCGRASTTAFGDFSLCQYDEQGYLHNQQDFYGQKQIYISDTINLHFYSQQRKWVIIVTYQILSKVNNKNRLKESCS